MQPFVVAMTPAASPTNATIQHAGGKPPPPALAGAGTTPPIPDSGHETDPVRYREERTGLSFLPGSEQDLFRALNQELGVLCQHPPEQAAEVCRLHAELLR